MSTLSVRLPNSLHRKLREFAEREGTSINQLISSAVAEKLAAHLTVEYLEERARPGSREKFEAALRTVPDVEPADFDRLPAKRSAKKPNPRGRGTAGKGKPLDQVDKAIRKKHRIPRDA
jgi:hypothetical protein